MTAAKGRRIGPEGWQTLLGVGGESSPGPAPVDERTTRPCEDCGKALHAHQRRKEYTENGRWKYALECPE